MGNHLVLKKMTLQLDLHTKCFIFKSTAVNLKLQKVGDFFMRTTAFYNGKFQILKG